jgi:hypothetical protein
MTSFVVAINSRIQAEELFCATSDAREAANSE